MCCGEFSGSQLGAEYLVTIVKMRDNKLFGEFRRVWWVDFVDVEIFMPNSANQLLAQGSINFLSKIVTR